MLTLAMPRHEWMLLAAAAVQVLWVFAFGACVGSLLNVLVYRLPKGLDVVTPSSRCPNCETKLTWRENIPILGWLLLRGRCRFCRSPISAEYPIVESFTALLWVVVFLTLYGDRTTWLGRVFAPLQPAWAAGGFVDSWPIFVCILCLFSCLIAITIIDARTFHIPMELNWAPVACALGAHAAWALYLQKTSFAHGLRATAPGWHWSLATPGPAGWWWIGAALGGGVGVVVANLLLWKGLISRSFADYDEWVASLPKQPKGAPEGTHQDVAGAPPATPSNEEDDSANPEMWTQYPHARREMLRELIFLAPIIGLALVGGWLAYRAAGPWTYDAATLAATPARQAPLWLMVLAGVFMGYLIGGGAVWLVRIAGSVAFGKEALGLGDVHLMAAVGACLGWIDSLLGFFGAAFVGLAWAVIGMVFRGKVQRHMPFGPYLAVATVLAWFFKPWIAEGIARIAHQPVGLP